MIGVVDESMYESADENNEVKSKKSEDDLSEVKFNLPIMMI